MCELLSSMIMPEAYGGTFLPLGEFYNIKEKNPIARSPDTVCLRDLSLCPLGVITRDPRPQCPTSGETSREWINYKHIKEGPFIWLFIRKHFLHVLTISVSSRTD